MSMISAEQAPYRVLARKYRPKNFDELIGQDALVRTLRNAISSGRIAHAFMLTGVRGVGKTTTARIIAKALNYTGPDGTSGPTTGPTDDCAVCRAITEDRHPDVIEMDAASRTGVDDIREILDGVRYAPTSARYKVYIIDEVHMLSKQAFNALLKTLEEPPPHVKFIFATTEIRKVPITVLSRCQRFDLRRVDVPTLIAHFQRICGLEQVHAEEDALAMVAAAADGSVRDGLSILDQAIALGGDGVRSELVRDMLGLIDRTRAMDLLEHALSGACEAALGVMSDLYRMGADPVVLAQDLLDLVHVLTRLKAAPNSPESQLNLSPDMRARAIGMAGKLGMASLGRAWQLLLKGLSEVQTAPNPQAAVEMVVIKLAYAADLPDPATLLKKLKEGGFAAASSGAPSAPAPSGGGPALRAIAGGGAMMAAAAAAIPATLPVEATAAVAQPETLEEVVALLEQSGHVLLAGQVFYHVRPVSLTPGRIEFSTDAAAPPKLSQDLGTALTKVTGMRWMVSVSTAPGAPSLAEAGKMRRHAEFEAVRALPLVQAVMETWPDAVLLDICDA